MEINNDTWRAFHPKEKKPFAGSFTTEAKQVDVNSTVGGDDTAHWSNFIDAIRSGEIKSLNCDIHEGHYSSSLPHLANISYRLERELKFMGDYERFADNEDADALLTRVYRHPYVVPDEV